MDEDLARRVASLRLAPVVVPWPSRQDRRAEVARSGAPCLLVVEPGATPPPVGDQEDWVLAGASERDVAARLESLVARAGSSAGRDRGALGGASAPVVPPLLTGDDARIARTLIGRSGRLVRWDDLAVDGGPANARRAVKRIRGALRDAGWSVAAVGSAGVVATWQQVPT